ncbi:transketolase [Clostridium sp. DMHC 10]|uniref:transketolase n=1 Tax=Clostridium sp. DMHC 10 TaxID=747377 RepID=UPI00069F2AB9|nr:transketolase [Clostridium sp. DMHC 10]KOF56454.1 transketolase [Clostridium sp. DMHC 10]
MSKELDALSIKAIRVISAEAIERAKSGHPGLPLGCAPMAYTLWTKMKHNGKNSKWDNRDRFVLSAGHGSMLEYCLLHLFGYGITMDDIKEFRQVGSKTPGHPEYGHTAGVEITTGPLGQGICNAVGMAIAEAYLANKFNKPNFNIVNHYTYAIAGDGCLMEGVSGEASSLAGTLGLGKLIVLYDSNNISIEGNTDIAFREDVAKRYEAYGWQVLKVDDGNDTDKVSAAIDEAKKETSKPSLIVVKNIIGFGCTSKQGTAGVHGSPLGEENIKIMKEEFGWSIEPFYVPKEVYDNVNEYIENGVKTEQAWKELFANYSKEYPSEAKEYELWFSGKVDEEALSSSEFWGFDKKMATRISSYAVINRLKDIVPNLIGGSADLAPSNKTYMNGRGDFSKEDRSGSNLHFGVREHAMAAISNGIAVHGGLKPFCSTFFVFSDYMKGAMRISALAGIPVTYVLTHDSIGVGEDGPTHEPIEQLAALRSIPHMIVFRPADSKETAAAWYYAVTSKKNPTSLVLTRQDLPLYEETGKAALKGAYILKDSEKKVPDIILMASGSEVELIYKAHEVLKKKGIDARVVSMPSFELFEAQSEEYKESVLPKAVRKRLAVEAASPMGWYKYIGLDGDIIAMNDFGASGKAEVLFEHYGFTVDNVIRKAEKVLSK